MLTPLQLHIVNFQEYYPPYDLVFSFFDGKTLDAEHASEPLKVSEFRMVTAQLLDAIASLHRLGLCHGQICPNSVVITKRWPVTHAMLLNFSFDSSIKEPSREAAMRKDMWDFLQLCILYVGGGRNGHSINSISSPSWQRLLFTMRRYVRDGQPSQLTESLAHNDEFIEDLQPQRDEDEHLPLQVDGHKLAPPDGVEITIPAIIPAGQEDATEVADDDESTLPDTLPWGDNKVMHPKDGASTLLDTSPVN